MALEHITGLEEMRIRLLDKDGTRNILVLGL